MTFTLLDACSVIDAKDNAVRHKRVACSPTKASARNQLEDEIVVVECSGLKVLGRLSKMRISDSTFVIEVGPVKSRPAIKGVPVVFRNPLL
jgi:hypothetical protein